MRRLAFIAALFIGIGFAPLAMAQNEPYVPALADIMSAAQWGHIKLWFAGKLQNWELARYELRQITPIVARKNLPTPDRAEIGRLPADSGSDPKSALWVSCGLLRRRLSGRGLGLRRLRLRLGRRLLGGLLIAAAASIGRQTNKRDGRRRRHHHQFPHIVISFAGLLPTLKLG